jgi:hypothetical protein
MGSTHKETKASEAWLGICLFGREQMDIDKLKKQDKARHQWLTPVILATQEAEIRRIVIPSQQVVHETLS